MGGGMSDTCTDNAPAYLLKTHRKTQTIKKTKAADTQNQKKTYKNPKSKKTGLFGDWEWEIQNLQRISFLFS